jgi:peptidyl-prolyl cis-trans isomerase D
MFDLFRSRDKAVRYLLGGLLGLVALSMVITLIPGYGSASRSPDEVVAQVGGEKITVRQVQLQLQNMMRNKSVPPEMVSMYLPQLIDQMISENALAYQAGRMGFQVSDTEAGNAIRSMLTQLFPDGNFNKAVYERFLNEQGLTVPEFEENIRKNLLVLKLRNLALEGVVVSPKEVAQEYNRRNDKIKLDYVVFDPAKLKEQMKVTPAEEMEYFTKNRDKFKLNEKRSFDLLLADQTKLASTITIPDADLRRDYDTAKDKFRTPERVHARHILISTTGKSPDEAKKLEAKAADILKQVKAGGDFAELAKKNSDDPGSAAKGGDLGWVVRGQMVKPFEEACFTLKPKEISNLVKTEYGFHIVQVLEKEDARLKPFEEVKDQIANEKKRQMVGERMQNAVDQAHAALLKNPAQVDQIAQQFGLELIKVANHGPGESLPELGTNSAVDTAIAALKVHDVTDVFQIGTDKMAVAELTGIQPVRNGEFNEVEPQVKAAVIDERMGLAAQQRNVKLNYELKTAGTDLKAIAKKYDMELKSTDEFTRDGAAEGIGPATYVEEAFNKNVGDMVGPFQVEGKTFYAKVTGKTTADPAKFQAARGDLLLQLKKKKANERKELFEDGLVTQLVKEGKIKKYPEAIQNPTQRARS